MKIIFWLISICKFNKVAIFAFMGIMDLESHHY